MCARDNNLGMPFLIIGDVPSFSVAPGAIAFSWWKKVDSRVTPKSYLWDRTAGQKVPLEAWLEPDHTYQLILKSPRARS